MYYYNTADNYKNFFVRIVISPSYTLKKRPTAKSIADSMEMLVMQVNNLAKALYSKQRLFSYWLLFCCNLKDHNIKLLKIDEAFGVKAIRKLAIAKGWSYYFPHLSSIIFKDMCDHKYCASAYTQEHEGFLQQFHWGLALAPLPLSSLSIFLQIGVFDDTILNAEILF